VLPLWSVLFHWVSTFDSFSRHECSSKELQECTSYRRMHEPSGVRKDNDFYHRLPLIEEDYDRLLSQVHRDLNFLGEELQVIDYSWLVGISKVVRQIDTSESGKYLLMSEVGTFPFCC
jgi:hypothetical protein